MNETQKLIIELQIMGSQIILSAAKRALSGEKYDTFPNIDLFEYARINYEQANLYYQDAKLKLDSTHFKENEG